MKLLLLPFAALISLFATGAGAGPHDDEADHSTPRCGSRDGLIAGPRVSALQRERQAKCADLKPYDSAFLERQILAVEKAERPRIDRINFLGFYPRIQTIDHRSQMAGGVRFWQPDLGRSPLDLAGSAFWSIEGFRFHEAHVGLLPHRGQDFPAFSYRTDDVFELPNVRQDDNSRFVLYANVAHRWAPQFDFYGLGADSRQEDHADFSSKDTLVEAVAGYRILPHVTVSARAGYHEVSTGPGEDETLPQVEDVFEPAEIPGFGQEPEFVRVGLSVVLDRRDVAKNPHRGGLLSVQWLGYDQRNVGAFSFDRLAADARLYRRSATPSACWRSVPTPRPTNPVTRAARFPSTCKRSSAAATPCAPTPASASAARSWSCSRPNTASKPPPRSRSRSSPTAPRSANAPARTSDASATTAAWASGSRATSGPPFGSTSPGETRVSAFSSVSVRASRGDRRPMYRVLLPFAVATTLVMSSTVYAQRFLPDDPVLRDHDDLHIPLPGKIELSTGYDVIENSLFRSQPEESAIGPARNVNTLGEVPDSSWWTNRIGAREMTLEDLARGPNEGDGPDVEGPWTVISGKAAGITPGFAIRDSRGDVYFVKVDPARYFGLATGADLVGSKFFHAFGYFVPETWIVYVQKHQIRVGEQARIRVLGSKPRKMVQEDLDQMLDNVARLTDGRIRFVASKAVPGKVVGPHKHFGTRPDDPNDVIPHEDRRELRGYRVFSAWLNHDDSRSLNSLDTYVEENGRGYLRHYLQDFSSMLGSGSDWRRSIAPQNPRAGNEYIIELAPMLKTIGTLGLWQRPWYASDTTSIPKSAPSKRTPSSRSAGSPNSPTRHSTACCPKTRSGRRASCPDSATRDPRHPAGSGLRLTGGRGAPRAHDHPPP